MKIWRAFSPVAIIIAGYLIYIGWWYFSLWFCVGYLLHGAGFECDLDLEGVTRAEALWIKSIILIPMIAMSTFYAKCLQKFGGHRSILSHGFFISSFIRLFYFASPFLYILRYKLNYWRPLTLEFTAMFFGLSLADSWHILADLISGEMAFGNRIGGKSIFWKKQLKHFFDYPPTKKGK